MFDWSISERLLIFFIIGPVYFWYGYLFILFIGVILVFSNRKKESIKNKIWCWIGKFLTIFIVINCICTALYIFSWAHR